MFDSPDHTTKIIENAISENCEDCSYTDADLEFSNSILYAKENGTDVILASKIAYILIESHHNIMLILTSYF